MYCDYSCRKELMGRHIFNHHNDELKTAFQRYKAVCSTTTYPFIGSGGWFYCFECKDWWNSREEVKAKHHYEKGKCNVENSRLRLYELIGAQQPVAQAFLICLPYISEASRCHHLSCLQ